MSIFDHHGIQNTGWFVGCSKHSGRVFGIFYVFQLQNRSNVPILNFQVAGCSWQPCLPIGTDKWFIVSVTFGCQLRRVSPLGSRVRVGFHCHDCVRGLTLHFIVRHVVRAYASCASGTDLHAIAYTSDTLRCTQLGMRAGVLRDVRASNGTLSTSLLLRVLRPS